MDILPPAQRVLWPSLRPLAGRGFALYGGTAAALRLGHRGSVDFDFYFSSDRPLDRDALLAVLPELARSTVLQDMPNTWTLLMGDAGIKVSLFGALTMGRAGEPELTDDGVLQVASSVDLLATKLKVLLQRVEAKDYLDIAALLASGTPLAQGLAAARAMFGPNFQPSECLKALVYFEGGDLETLPHTQRTLLIKAASQVRQLPEMPVLDTRLTLPT
jgi:hypothetical protein